MSNLTFDERLIREHTPAPLEGHIVVVLERVGESGEKFHSLLEPGGERPRLGVLRFLRREPSRYFAFAVDASKGRLLAFSEQVRMADGSRGFELQLSLWYRVLDPRLLVATRASDPLGRVRRRVAEVITEEIAELPWREVWHSFRVASDTVVAGTLAALKAFAREHGISITTLRLRASFPESAIETDRKIHEVHERGRLGRERLDVAQELQNHRSSLRRDNADREEEDRAAAARRALQTTMIQKYDEFLRGAGSVDDLHDVQRAMAAGPGSAGVFVGGSPTLAPVASPAALPPGGDELPVVLSDLVALTHQISPIQQCRRIRGIFLHLVAAVVADDSRIITREQARYAKEAQDCLGTTRLPSDRLQALSDLADPRLLHARLNP